MKKQLIGAGLLTALWMGMGAEALACRIANPTETVTVCEAPVMGEVWTPGTQGGKPVDMGFTLPINFKL